VVARVVGRKSLFVDRFENGAREFLLVSEEVGATRSIVSKLGFKTFMETLLNLLDVGHEAFGARHGAKNFNA